MIRWMWFLPVGGLPCGWPVARVTPAWWNCCFQLELTKNQVKLNLNGWANLMEGCIPKVRMGDAESNFLCFYFLIDVFMIHDILVLLFTIF